LIERGEVSGDAVSTAARIRSFAESGVCVSGEVYHSVRNQPNIEARPLGEHELRNVGCPFALFAIRGTAAAPSAPPAHPATSGSAMNAFERAIELDPGHAPAHAWLGEPRVLASPPPPASGTIRWTHPGEGP
jgi:hypothetical protein